MNRVTTFQNKLSLLFILGFLYSTDIWARAGGGGGRSHSSSGGGGGGYHGGGGYGGGGGGLFIGNPGILIVIIIIVVIWVLMNRNKVNAGSPDNGGVLADTPPVPFPEGLDPQKVQTSFLSIQDGWQKKDLKPVRKWMSDGVYQRYTAQFAIMNKLSQVNKLSNIRIHNISVVKTATEGNYQTADVGISFSMDDAFMSDKYPVFNEVYNGDTDAEVWTFIRRNDASGKNLYDNNNCPNCGSLLDIKMGEISRCSSCGTLTNNASYDWVLSEITQGDDYQGDNQAMASAEQQQLLALTQNDRLFSKQRIEDVASNVFMQIMEVMTGGNAKKLSRFADKDTATDITKIKATGGNYIFDRLYLNDVTLVGMNTQNERLNLIFSLTATYKRVALEPRLTQLDSEAMMHNYTLVLSKNLSALKTPEKETVYSYECPSCGAPYTDTTDDVCTYCGEPVIDLNKNWVLTAFQQNS